MNNKTKSKKFYEEFIQTVNSYRVATIKKLLPEYKEWKDWNTRNINFADNFPNAMFFSLNYFDDFGECVLTAENTVIIDLEHSSSFEEDNAKVFLLNGVEDALYILFFKESDRMSEQEQRERQEWLEMIWEDLEG